MLVAYFGGLEIVNDCIDECRFASDVHVRMYAAALDYYRRTAQHSKRDYAPSAPGVTYQPILERYLEDIRTGKQSWFQNEVECALHAALSVALLLQGKPLEALHHASQTIYLGEVLGASICIERGRSLQVSCLAATGQLAYALSVLDEASVEFQTASTKPYNFRMHAFCLSQLGRLDDALDVLNQAKNLRLGNDARVESELTRIKLLWGIGGVEEDFRATFSKSEVETQLFKSLHALLKGYQLPRRSTTMNQRSALFREAVHCWQGVTHGHEEGWATFMGQWIQAKAHYLLGQTSLALNGFENFAVPSNEFLDIRVLKAGMALDLALHTNQPGTDVLRWLEELHGVFQDARKVPFASGQGLAQRLKFWHPTAAAFAAVVTNPIRELASAVNGVLMVGAKCRLRDQDIPPAYAAELALRALDVDLNPRIKFAQAVLGKHRERRQELEQRPASHAYAQGAISAATIIFGLVKLKDFDAAQTIYNEYGVTPRSNAGYEMLEMNHLIDRYTQMLISREMDIALFSHAVNDLGSGLSYENRPARRA